MFRGAEPKAPLNALGFSEKPTINRSKATGSSCFFFSRPHLLKRLARGGGAAASARSSLSGGASPSQLAFFRRSKSCAKTSPLRMPPGREGLAGRLLVNRTASGRGTRGAPLTAGGEGRRPSCIGKQVAVGGQRDVDIAEAGPGRLAQQRGSKGCHG